MKSKINIVIAVLFAAVIGFSSCSEEAENQAPMFESITVGADNETVTLKFSEAVYAKADATGNLSNENLSVSIEGVEFTYEVVHTAGESSLTINLDITSITEGTEAVVVKPVAASPIYDVEGEAMSESESLTSDALEQNLGIIDEWYSSGDNVAPLLVTYFQVDSIYARFNADMSYYVEQYNIGNATTTPDLIFTGNFTMEKSDVGEIWTIDLVQEEPYAANSSGIYEVKTDPEVLWYEVVQTSGTENTPPTPEEGFGSTNGGTLGDSNIQKYIRL